MQTLITNQNRINFTLNQSQGKLHIVLNLIQL